MSAGNASRLLDRLRIRLVKEHGIEIPEPLYLRRTRAGHVQRRNGAWSWYAVDSGGFEIMGSQYPLAELVRASELGISRDYRVPPHWDIDIMPVTNVRPKPPAIWELG